MYLTYEEYVAMGGTLPEAEYALAEFRARKRLDYLTAGRIQGMAEVPDAVKQCVLSIVKAEGVLATDAQADAPPVAAFTSDGYSETYADPAQRAKALEAALNSEIARLLWDEKDDGGVPLLCRRVR
ncbi:MAG: hypothetical protein Q4C10_06335 [Clostridia bacterium]|nr:hypothetical protein [Clostridia bacterium]